MSRNKLTCTLNHHRYLHDSRTQREPQDPKTMSLWGIVDSCWWVADWFRLNIQLTDVWCVFSVNKFCRKCYSNCWAVCFYFKIPIAISCSCTWDCCVIQICRAGNIMREEKIVLSAKAASSKDLQWPILPCASQWETVCKTSAFHIVDRH